MSRRHRELTGLGARHPRVGVDAPDAEPGDDELVPARLEQLVRRAPAHRAAEDRVVPVHRVRRLVLEQVAVLADGVSEPAASQLPLGLRVVEQLGERDPGAQRLVDARGAGQQREVLGRGPLDAAERELLGDHPVEPGPHRRPEPLHEPQVAADQPVVPDADGEVRGHVDLTALVVGHTVDDLHRPRAVRTLHGGHPGVGVLGGLDLSAHEHRHRGLDVVPDVDVLPDRPGHGSARLLHGRDGRGAVRHLGRGQHAVDVRQLGEVRHAAPSAEVGLRK